MKKQQKRYPGLTKAEKDYIKTQERREIIATAITMVIALLIVAWIVRTVGEVLAK